MLANRIRDTVEVVARIGDSAPVPLKAGVVILWVAAVLYLLMTLAPILAFAASVAVGLTLAVFTFEALMGHFLRGVRSILQREDSDG